MTEKDKKFFQFTDDEFIALTMFAGTVRKASEDLSNRFVKDALEVYKPMINKDGNMETQYARMASVCQAYGERVMFSAGILFAKMLPADVSATFVTQMLNEFIKGYCLGTKNVFEISFECAVACDANKYPEVALATQMSADLVPHLGLAMVNFAIKEMENDRGDGGRPPKDTIV